MNNIESSKGEIVMYQPDETIRLEVRVEDETVWLTQQQMAELFLTTKQNVSLHVNNIFREDELTENSVVKESLTTAREALHHPYRQLYQCRYPDDTQQSLIWRHCHHLHPSAEPATAAGFATP